MGHVLSGLAPSNPCLVSWIAQGAPSGHSSLFCFTEEKTKIVKGDLDFSKHLKGGNWPEVSATEWHQSHWHGKGIQ